MQRRTFLGTAVVGLVASTAAQAQFLGGEDSQGTASQILMVGGFSLQTSQIAMQRSRNARVRDFAQLEAGQQEGLAAAVGAQPGSVPLGQEQAAILEQMQSLSGRQFDRMYIDSQIHGHKQLLQLNSANAHSGAGGVGQAVSIVAVPSIQTHLYMLSHLRSV